jgi:signal transduction histidine kinase/ligand-binding sensor domain-containing protein
MGRGRDIALRIFFVCVMATWSPKTYALDPTLNIGQYAHTSWKIREGFVGSSTAAIAQTSDGYLWFGTSSGLFRFDGVRFVPWQAPNGGRLPADQVRSLLAARDGTLWIGTHEGLARWTGHGLVQYPELEGWLIQSLVQDSGGTVSLIAAGLLPNSAKVCAIRSDGSCDGEGGLSDRWMSSLLEDRMGRVWAASPRGLWRLKPGPAELFPVHETAVSGGLQEIAESGSGAIVIGTVDGLMELRDGEMRPFRLPLATQDAERAPTAVLVDRQGALWAGTEHGLLHIHQGQTDTFTRADGLSGDRVICLFEDHEGNIWVATTDGLDRFREYAAVPFGIGEGLTGAYTASVLASSDGGVWVSRSNGLNQWIGGHVNVFPEQGTGVSPLAVPSGASPSAASEMVKGGASLFEDHEKKIWIGSPHGLGYLENGQLHPVREVPSGYVDSFASDRAGNLWIAHRDLGLLRLSASHQVEQQISWAHMGHSDPALLLAADPQRGGVWLGFLLGGVGYVADGEVRESYSVADGLAKGRVRHLRVDEAGTLWVATEGGLSRVKDRRVATLSMQDGLPCSTVDWTIDDDADSVWLYMGCGIVRIARSELDAWSAAADQGMRRTIQTTVLASSDGVRNFDTFDSFTPRAAKSRDGKLWFAAADGAIVIDPRHIPRNSLPPPVHIEDVVADRTLHEVDGETARISLPPLARDLRIDYTATSFVEPEKVQFRYRLEPHDRDWQDAGNRRQAFYTDLPPGDYRFHVIASNNDGVWNEVGASLDLSVAPAFYQTRWFIALCLVVGFAGVWLAYTLRVRQIESRMQLRLDERVAERERIARDLHDTFLQSVQGLMLKFQAVMARMPEEEPARALLEQALERADGVIIEGRDRVYELRGSNVKHQGLAEALADVAAELTPIAPTSFSVSVVGEPRPLHPVVREEAYRIGAEALRNAFQHAAAAHIDLEIEYTRQGLSVRIVDDGRGFDVATLADNSRHKHFGLAGLRERAQKIRSELEVSSKPGLGTEVALHVPGVVAYAPERPTKAVDG